MKVNRISTDVWLVVAINVFALWICAMFAGLVLDGALDDLGDVQLCGGVFDALERLFWLTGDRMG